VLFGTKWGGHHYIDWHGPQGIMVGGMKDIVVSLSCLLEDMLQGKKGAE
jgi:hypothetical protein